VGSPPGAVPAGDAVGIPTEWRFPSDEHPPEDTRWEARWGHYKHPHQRQA
jgi:hypothetical protein